MRATMHVRSEYLFSPVAAIRLAQALMSRGRRESTYDFTAVLAIPRLVGLVSQPQIVSSTTGSITRTLDGRCFGIAAYSLLTLHGVWATRQYYSTINLWPLDERFN